MSRLEPRPVDSDVGVPAGTGLRPRRNIGLRLPGRHDQHQRRELGYCGADDDVDPTTTAPQGGFETLPGGDQSICDDPSNCAFGLGCTCSNVPAAGGDLCMPNCGDTSDCPAGTPLTCQGGVCLL